MIVEVTERVLTYRRADLEAWRLRDRSIVPSFYPLELLSHNQPSFGFAEMLALRHFHETEGWWGFLHYDLGDGACTARRMLGQRKALEIIPRDRLQRLQALQPRRTMLRWPGKPDLFLYRGVGDFMFAEVKKQTDALREPQFRVIAQLMAILDCPVEIVYAREEQQRYRPKRYAFDLESFGGRRIA